MLRSYITLALCMLALSVQAATITWQGDDVANPTAWSDPDNWDLGRVPNGEDHVMIHYAGTGAFSFPVVDSDVGEVRILSPSYYAGQSEITFPAGGKLYADWALLGHAASGETVITVAGGELDTRRLQVAENGNVTIEIQDGWVRASLLEFGSGEALIDLRGGALRLVGPQDEAAQAWIAGGLVQAYGGAGRVLVDYNATYVDETTLVGLANREQAFSPSPSNGSGILASKAANMFLEWQAGESAVHHDLYFGTDAATVAEAEMSHSPVYLGRQMVTSWTLPSLEPDTTYYWRVDEVDASGGMVPGAVWSFSTGREAVELESGAIVATDALGRELPDIGRAGTERADRVSGIFYFLWQGHHGEPGPHDVTRILSDNPSDPAWVEGHGMTYWWTEPEVGYFLGDDEWVHRYHLSMLYDAGIDVLFLDATNSFTYRENNLHLFKVLHEMQLEGYATDMKVCFFTNAGSPQAVTDIYNWFYSRDLYSGLWFYLDGKPLVLGIPDGLPTDNPQVSVSQEIRDFFTWRYCWFNQYGQDLWSWQTYYPQGYSWHDAPDRVEQLPVTTTGAGGPMPRMGRSFQAKLSNYQPPHNAYHLTGYEHLGLHFSEQWERAQALDPEILFISSWNEWITGRWQHTEDDGLASVYHLGQEVALGGYYFVDQYNQEYSRDIAPMKGGHTDNYYYQMWQENLLRKGAAAAPVAGGAVPVGIDGAFSEWEFVTPVFHDMPGDAVQHSHEGFGIAGPYVNTTGRNDFVALKVARDETYVAFYARTHDELTPSTDASWMLLFIDVDRDASTGWEGYDYLVNYNQPGTLYVSSGGWNWTLVRDDLPYAVSGNQLELRVARADLGLPAGDGAIAFDFHWADNMQTEGDLIAFASEGDSAPNRRANFRYETAPLVETVLLEDDFESGSTSPNWNDDWDIVTTDAYEGSHALECSADDNVGLLSRPLDLTAAHSFRTEFMYKLSGGISDIHNINLWYHDGTEWNFIDEIGKADNDVWLRYVDYHENAGTDTSLFSNSLGVHIQGIDLTLPGQQVLLDNVRVTAMVPRSKAAGPYPPDGATGVSVHTSLGWTAPPAAESHRVYLGESAPVDLQGEQTGIEHWRPGVPLRYETTYYWRVDGVTPSGTQEGDVWSFTTGPSPDPASVENLWMMY